MNKFEIIKEPGAEAATAAAGEALNNLLQETAEEPVLLLLSAGSALNMLDYVGVKGLGESLTVGMLDERYSVDEKVNNFAQFQKTEFYTEALKTEVNFFGSLPRPGETQTQLAERMENSLRNWKQENPNGKIFATLGMGKDGHTAGMFPSPENQDEFAKLFEGENWVTGYDAKNKNQYPLRVTATATFLKSINIGLALVCGQEKLPKLQELIRGKPNLYEQPSAIWHEIKSLRIFTDLDL